MRVCFGCTAWCIPEYVEELYTCLVFSEDTVGSQPLKGRCKFTFAIDVVVKQVGGLLATFTWNALTLLFVWNWNETNLRVGQRRQHLADVPRGKRIFLATGPLR